MELVPGVEFCHDEYHLLALEPVSGSVRSYPRDDRRLRGAWQLRLAVGHTKLSLRSAATRKSYDRTEVEGRRQAQLRRHRYRTSLPSLRKQRRSWVTDFPRDQELKATKIGEVISPIPLRLRRLLVDLQPSRCVSRVCALIIPPFLVASTLSTACCTRTFGTPSLFALFLCAWPTGYTERLRHFSSKDTEGGYVAPTWSVLWLVVALGLSTPSTCSSQC